MRHLVSGRKLKRTSSHRKALMKNLATALFEHKRITTTEAKAKELRPYAEKLISKAKRALHREKQGVLPQGQTVDVHSRREVGRHIRSKAVLQELFDTIAPMVTDRQGGYTRIVKLGFRRGDAGRTALIELVDWAAPQDGAVSTKSKKKTARPAAAKPAAVAPAPAKAVPAAVQPAAAPEETASAVVDAGETPDVTSHAAPDAVVEETPAEVSTAMEEAEMAPATEAEFAESKNEESEPAQDDDSDFKILGKTDEEKS